MRTEIKVVVLSEEPFDFTNLATVAHAITDGDCSGECTVLRQKWLVGKAAADAVIAQGSDPEFFGIDDDGDDKDTKITCPRCKGRQRVPDQDPKNAGHSIPCPHCEGEGKVYKHAEK